MYILATKRLHVHLSHRGQRVHPNCAPVSSKHNMATTELCTLLLPANGHIPATIGLYSHCSHQWAPCTFQPPLGSMHIVTTSGLHAHPLISASKQHSLWRYSLQLPKINGLNVTHTNELTAPVQLDTGSVTLMNEKTVHNRLLVDHNNSKGWSTISPKARAHKSKSM